MFAYVDHDHNPFPLVNAKAAAANPQDIVPPQGIEDSIPSRYNPRVDYEPTPPVSRENSDSLQNTWVVDEDESTDNVDDTATTRDLEIKSVDGDDPIATVSVSPENMLSKEDNSAGHPISPDLCVGQGSRPTLIDRLIEILRTSSYHTFPAAQEKVIKYCEILSRMGVNISGLSARLQQLFKEAEAIQEVAAHPSYFPSARILETKEHKSRITKELKDYDCKMSSLTRTKEDALTLLDQQRQKVEDLERTLVAARTKEAELNDKVNTINECISWLKSSKDKAVATMEGAIEEFGATEGSHGTTVEFNHLSDLIKDFELHCKEFDL